MARFMNVLNKEEEQNKIKIDKLQQVIQMKTETVTSHPDENKNCNKPSR
jgi:hypothetical protein